MHLSVIVPVYNEARTLEKNFQQYFAYLDRQNFNYELIAVNDGSTDESGIILDNLAKQYPRLKIINQDRNQGKGAAVCRGLLAGQGRWRLFLDADGATSIDHIDLIWPEFKSGADLVIASRQPRDAATARIDKHQAVHKKLLGQAGNLLIRWLAVSGIKDTQCGFKAFTAEAVQAVIPQIKTKGWAFDVEILSRAQQNNLLISIIPARWVNGEHSTVKLWHYPRTVWELVKIKYYLSR